jgi:hypothetical protein
MGAGIGAALAVFMIKKTLRNIIGDASVQRIIGTKENIYGP